jgi:hypothetical protein
MDERAGEIEGVASSRLPVKRDQLGFVVSEQPDLSASQVRFILAAASTHSNNEAAEIADVDMEEVLQWFENPSFTSVYQSFMQNKREGVKQIGQQLLPTMLLELSQIMQNGSNKEKLGAAKLIAQMQGLLITQGAPVDRGMLEALREEIIRPRPISYRDVTQQEE